MSADEAEEVGRPFIGFHTFADDTPRDFPDSPPSESYSRSSASAPGQWIGPAGGQDFANLVGNRRAKTAFPRPAGLVAALIAVGLVGGAAAGLVRVERKTPNDKPLEPSGAPTQIHIVSAPPPLAMALTTAPQPIGQPVGAAPAPPASARTSPTPAAAGPNVLPAPTLDETPGLVTPAPTAPQADAVVPQIVAGPQIAKLTPPPSLSQPPPPQAAQPSSAATCAYALTRAAQMVCHNPALAADDRQLARVYDAAIAAGAPERRLAREQRDWFNAREAAAGRSPQDVAKLYALRLRDLSQWLEDDSSAQRGG